MSEDGVDDKFERNAETVERTCGQEDGAEREHMSEGGDDGASKNIKDGRSKEHGEEESRASVTATGKTGESVQRFEAHRHQARS